VLEKKELAYHASLLFALFSLILKKELKSKQISLWAVMDGNIYP
jgi:hypothetical protein